MITDLARQAGLAPEAVRAVVLVGDAHLDDALAACPRADVFVVGAIAPRARVTVAAATPAAPGFTVSLLAELAQFLAHRALGPGEVVVAPVHADTTAAADDTGLDALAVVHDLCSGYSRRLLPALAGAGATGVALLRAIGAYLQARGELYHALKYHFTLYRRTGEAALAWRALECLADLGAARTLGSWLDQPPFSDELRAKIRADLAPELAARGEAGKEIAARNLAAIAAFSPSAAAALSAAASADAPDLLYLGNTPWRLGYDGHTLGMARDEYPLLVRSAGDFIVEVNPPPDARERAEMATLLSKRDQPHALVLGWTRHAWAVEMLLATRVDAPWPGWRRLLFLLEDDVATLAALLGTIDLSARLTSALGHAAAAEPQLFLGPDAQADFLRALAATPDLPAPGVIIGPHAALEAAFAGVRAARLEAAAASKRRLDARDGRARLHDTLAALGGARPLRALVVTTLYSDVVRHVARDFATAMQRLGHTCEVLSEGRPGHVTHYQSLGARLEAFDPDFVLLFNHTRAEAAAFHPRDIPYVTWIQDELPQLKDPSLVRLLGPLDFAYGFSGPVQRNFQALGYPFVGHLPFAIAPPPEGFTRPITHEGRRDDVAFITHVPRPREPHFLPGVAAWMEARLQALRPMPLAMPEMQPLAREAAQALGRTLRDDEHEEVVFFAAMLARSLERVRVIDALLAAGIPCALYGKGWPDWPRFAPHWRGVIEPGAPLGDVMSQHKVVLHINRGCNLHPRVLEGFAAGAFVVAQEDGCDQLPGETIDQFEIGRELCLFQNDEHMLFLVRWALRDERWRRKKVEASRIRILRSHTYQHRIATIVADLRAGLAAHLGGP